MREVQAPYRREREQKKKEEKVNKFEVLRS